MRQWGGGQCICGVANASNGSMTRAERAPKAQKCALRSEACNALGASDGINHMERCRALAQNRVNHIFIEKSMTPPYTLVIYAHGTWPQKCLSMGPSRHPLILHSFFATVYLPKRVGRKIAELILRCGVDWGGQQCQGNPFAASSLPTFGFLAIVWHWAARQLASILAKAQWAAHTTPPGQSD